MADFNPYHKWLGIPPESQPVTHYRLLGISDFEADVDVIEAGAEQRTVFLRSFQTGPNAELAEQLLNEVSEARVNLLDGKTKARYDTQLRAVSQPSSPPVPVPPEVGALPAAPVAETTEQVADPDQDPAGWVSPLPESTGWVSPLPEVQSGAAERQSVSESGAPLKEEAVVSVESTSRRPGPSSTGAGKRGADFGKSVGQRLGKMPLVVWALTVTVALLLVCWIYLPEGSLDWELADWWQSVTASRIKEVEEEANAESSIEQVGRKRFEVSGAGERFVNGSYVYSGNRNGRPTYTENINQDVVVYWDSGKSFWAMAVILGQRGISTDVPLTSNRWLYTNESDTPDAPVNGWRGYDGALPPPRIVASVAGKGDSQGTDTETVAERAASKAKYLRLAKIREAEKAAADRAAAERQRLLDRAAADRAAADRAAADRAAADRAAADRAAAGKVAAGKVAAGKAATGKAATAAKKAAAEELADVRAVDDDPKPAVPAAVKPLPAGVSRTLEAYYPFPGNAEDASGNVRHGTVLGAKPARDRLGYANMAYEFSSAKSRIEIRQGPRLSDLTSFTFSAWFKWVPDKENTESVIISKANASNNKQLSYQLYVDRRSTRETRGDLRAKVGYKSDPPVLLTSSTKITAGQWYAVTFTYKSGVGIAALYLNGKQVDVERSVKQPNTKGLDPVTIGPWHGSLDDIRIFSDRLTGTEVGKVYDFDNKRRPD